MRALRVAVVVAAALAQAACASVAEVRKLENRVARLSGGEVGEQTRAQLADLAAQMDRMNREMDELRGQLEVASHKAETAVQEARRAREEADAAVRAASGGAASLPPAPSEGAPAATPGGDTGPAVEIESSPGAVVGGTASAEVAQYRRAYGAWRRDEVAACIEGFREFLQTYPSSPYADDALYWMADCYTKQGDHEKAILRFAKVVELYPKGNKAPDALFRQGEVLLKLGPGYSSAARDVFQRVVSEYPDSPRASEAQRQLDRLGAG